MAIRAGLSAIRAAAARHALVLDDLAIKVVLRLDNAAKEHPAVHAGVRVVLLVEVEIMISGSCVRWVRGRLLLVHSDSSFPVGRVPGCG
jgi:hypothetical protein